MITPKTSIKVTLTDLAIIKEHSNENGISNVAQLHLMIKYYEKNNKIGE